MTINRAMVLPLFTHYKVYELDNMSFEDFYHGMKKEYSEHGKDFDLNDIAKIVIDHEKLDPGKYYRKRIADIIVSHAEMSYGNDGNCDDEFTEDDEKALRESSKRTKNPVYSRIEEQDPDYESITGEKLFDIRQPVHPDLFEYVSNYSIDEDDEESIRLSNIKKIIEIIKLRIEETKAYESEILSEDGAYNNLFLSQFESMMSSYGSLSSDVFREIEEFEDHEVQELIDLLISRDGRSSAIETVTESANIFSVYASYGQRVPYVVDNSIFEYTNEEFEFNKEIYDDRMFMEEETLYHAIIDLYKESKTFEEFEYHLSVAANDSDSKIKIKFNAAQDPSELSSIGELVFHEDVTFEIALNIEELKGMLKTELGDDVEYEEDLSGVSDPIWISRDGLTVAVELTTRKALRDESRRMGNCVGTIGAYWVGIEKGDGRIISIRTGSGRSRFTIELRRDQFGWRVSEIRGKANREPGFSRSFDQYIERNEKFKSKEVIELIFFLKEYLGMDLTDIKKIEDLKSGIYVLMQQIDDKKLSMSKDVIKRIKNPSDIEEMINRSRRCNCHCCFCCECSR